MFFKHILLNTVLLIWLISVVHSTDGRGVDTNNDFYSEERPVTDWKAIDSQKISRARQQVRKTLELDKPARNIILFLGDGMGVSTLTAARIYKSQLHKARGQAAELSWESMPHVALAKTYSNDLLTPDSASTATAFLCGEKTNGGTIGVNQNGVFNNCSTLAGNEIPSILHLGIQDRRWGGVVTTASVTDGSPAATYAHTTNRLWENDAAIPLDDRDTCTDIASQLIDKDIRVVLGGGREHFFPNTTADEEYPAVYGKREDGRDLVQEWLDVKPSRGISPSQVSYVNSLDGFNSVDPEETEYLLGLFELADMQYEIDRTDASKENFGEPSLTQMVEKAIRILDKSPDGYFLFVEGGRIDHAHHANNAQRALNDTLALSDAVERAMELTDESDTLIVVTSDHSHSLTISGFPSINTNIFQFDTDIERQLPQFGLDRKPFATLSYATGPGYFFHRTEDGTVENSTLRKNVLPLFTEMTDKDYLQDSPVPLPTSFHTGEDVAVFARGPQAHLFQGTQEQSYIGNVMMYAFCVGDDTELCDNPPTPSGAFRADGIGASAPRFIWGAIFYSLILSYTFLLG